MPEPEPNSAPGGAMNPANGIDPVDVFISYKVDPDEPLATAVERLIESSISPSPKVFVASVGGLRPSSSGFHQQLQGAVQRATFVLGIITAASKDREWIFFEAGAAWGLGKAYSPLLFEMEAAELPTSIAGYQATFTRKETSVRALLQEVAKSIRGKLKAHWRRSYEVFLREVEQHGRVATDPPNTAPAPDDNLRRAFALMLDGNTEEATTLFDQALAAAPDDARKSHIEVSRIVSESKLNGDALNRLDRLPQELRNSIHFHYWSAIFETRLRPHIARAHWKHVLESRPSSSTRREAIIAHANLLYRAGRQEEGTDRLVTALSDADRELRALAAQALLRLPHIVSPASRLLVLAGCLTDGQPELIRMATDLAIDAKWRSLMIHFAEAHGNIQDDGTSRNNLGRAYQLLGWPSAAFRAYERAIEAGANVGRANQANLFAFFAVPSAGLAVLKPHIGDFDCGDPEFPHDVRGRLEKAVHEETEQIQTLRRAGASCYSLIAEFADSAFLSEARAARPRVGVYIGRLGSATLTASSDGHISVQAAEAPSFSTLQLRALQEFPWIWVLYRGDDVAGFFVFQSGDKLRGVSFSTLSEGLRPRADDLHWQSEPAEIVG